MRAVPVLASALLLATPALAGTVTVQVRDAGGQPLAGAVVEIDAPGTPAPAPGGSYEIAQQDISFQPHLLIVPVGASVGFPNRDKVRHHVYSFSKAKRFNLKLYGREEQRAVLFDRPGVVALGCNIHDTMSGFVYVTPSRFTVQSDASGRAVLANVPEGRATVKVWHPTIRAPDNMLAQPLAVGPRAMTATVAAAR